MFRGMRGEVYLPIGPVFIEYESNTGGAVGLEGDASKSVYISRSYRLCTEHVRNRTLITCKLTASNVFGAPETHLPQLKECGGNANPHASESFPPTFGYM